MSLCRILVLSAAAAMLAGATASAEERWTALYWGVNGGYAWGDSDWAFPATASPDLEGEFVGLHAGYQQHIDAFVIGFEASFDFANLEGAATCPNPAASCENSLNQLATAGLRLGLAADRALIFATGGYAYGTVESRVFFPATPALDEAADEGHGGWYAGVGMDYLLNRDVMLGVEYLYVDLDDRNHHLNRIATGAFVETANIDPKTHVVRIRLAAKVVGLFED